MFVSGILDFRILRYLGFEVSRVSRICGFRVAIFKGLAVSGFLGFKG
jgi:hypothetical protein